MFCWWQNPSCTNLAEFPSNRLTAKLHIVRLFWVLRQIYPAPLLITDPATPPLCVHVKLIGDLVTLWTGLPKFIRQKKKFKHGQRIQPLWTADVINLLWKNFFHSFRDTKVPIILLHSSSPLLHFIFLNERVFSFISRRRFLKGKNKQDQQSFLKVFTVSCWSY